MYELQPAELLTDFSAERAFPFVEHDNGDVTGYGHQDPATFAEAVNLYDRCLVEGGFSSGWQPDDVEHAWAIGDEFADSADEALLLVPEDVPGAVPVTVLWGRR